MHVSPFRLLLVEDNDADAALFCKAITQCPHFGKVHITRAESIRAARELLGLHACDVVVLDLAVPDGAGLETLQAVHKVSRIPIVVLTSLQDCLTAMEVISAGAQDFLLKKEMDGATLYRTLMGAVSRWRYNQAANRNATFCAMLDGCQYVFQQLTGEAKQAKAAVAAVQLRPLEMVGLRH